MPSLRLCNEVCLKIKIIFKETYSFKVPNAFIHLTQKYNEVSKTELLATLILRKVVLGHLLKYFVIFWKEIIYLYYSSRLSL